ncbi:HAD-IA family hydrolase [Saccharothrix lopnurensis]|uniref:HAD-IA family hydrolase n=1 Tax=Saccharothrix lopnurensis TaxID=1670621 RepID=A0ABW1NWP7_9PSEU
MPVLATPAWRLECAAVLFDMDGTLVDSSRCVDRTWRAWCARHGLDAEALFRVSHGRRNHETVALVAPHLDVAREVADLVRAEEACLDGIVPVPGAPELLAALPRDRWAVVTSAWRRLAGLRLRAAGLPEPGVLVTADDVAAGKPDPEGYLKAAADLGVEPERCVVLEDAPAGLAAARAAGMRAVAVRTTMGDGRLAARWSVDDLEALRYEED